MPRKKRILLAGEVAHIMSRGIDGCSIFLNDVDRLFFLSLLAKELSRCQFRCYAWVLMPNHYHLILRLSDQNAGFMMRRLNGTYAQYFNRKHKRRGYLFQDRFKSLATREFMYFRELIRYVHLNPLRAKIVKSLEDLAAYQWCGHRMILGLGSAPWMWVPDVLAKFGKTVHQARIEYVSYLQQKVDDEAGHGPLAAVHLHPEAGGIVDERIIGSVEFVKAAVEKAEREKRDWVQRLKSRPSLAAIMQNIARRTELEEDELLCRGRGNTISAARSEFCSEARRKYGYKLKEISGYLGITPAAVVRMVGPGTGTQH